MWERDLGKKPFWFLARKSVTAAAAPSQIFLIISYSFFSYILIETLSLSLSLNPILALFFISKRKNIDNRWCVKEKSSNCFWSTNAYPCILHFREKPNFYGMIAIVFYSFGFISFVIFLRKVALSTRLLLL